jgi:ABC-type phosphate transport system substrate-binding protein
MKLHFLYFILFFVFLFGPYSYSSTNSFQIIVNTENPIQSIDRKPLADMFLKRTTRWSDELVIQPVDLEPESEVREEFSQKILKRKATAVRSYWQRLLFSGRNIPPPEYKTDEEVIRFVSENRSAIGYVSSSATIRGGVKTVVLK